MKAAVWRKVESGVALNPPSNHTSTCVPFVSPPSNEEDGDTEVLTRDYVLSESQSLTAELMDAEYLDLIAPNKLATFLCGFLNSEEGGTIYVGVKNNGLIRGVLLNRKQRDYMRQALDKVLATKLLPRVAPGRVAATKDVSIGSFNFCK